MFQVDTPLIAVNHIRDGHIGPLLSDNDKAIRNVAKDRAISNTDKTRKRDNERCVKGRTTHHTTGQPTLHLITLCTVRQQFSPAATRV